MTAEEMVARAWADTSPKVDWLGMENCLREFVREFRLGNVRTADPSYMLEGVAEIIAAYTKRGKP